MVERSRTILARCILGSFLVAIALGCQKPAPPELRRWSRPATSSAEEPGAFTEYLAAARSVEAGPAALLDRVSFFPDQRRRAIAEFDDEAARVMRASARAASFPVEERGPFEPVPHVKGWRLIGRVMAWQVEDDVEAGNLTRAIDRAVAATRFGFDLTGGGAIEASLGLAIVDDARRALITGLSQMDAAQLRRLSQGMKSALTRKPSGRVVADREADRMLRTVDYLQDAAMRNDFDRLRERMGDDGREIANYLGRIRNDGEALASFFDGLGTEALDRIENDAELAELPAALRKGKELKPDNGRLWRRPARHFLETMPPYRAAEDRTVARTRLLIMTAELMRRQRLKQELPRMTDVFSESVRIDPYSGESMLLTSDGIDFTVYSVGDDLVDNGGETDLSGTLPDLQLERP